jgi:hypothetical protein
MHTGHRRVLSGLAGPHTDTLRTRREDRGRVAPPSARRSVRAQILHSVVSRRTTNVAGKTAHTLQGIPAEASSLPHMHCRHTTTRTRDVHDTRSSVSLSARAWPWAPPFHSAQRALSQGAGASVATLHSARLHSLTTSHSTRPSDRTNARAVSHQQAELMNMSCGRDDARRQLVQWCRALRRRNPPRLGAARRRPSQPVLTPRDGPPSHPLSMQWPRPSKCRCQWSCRPAHTRWRGGMRDERIRTHAGDARVCGAGGRSQAVAPHP